eukprot:scaffold640799_cov28-Prasinocladus_malaysianus.AAC.1
MLKGLDESIVEGEVPDGVLVKGLFLEGGSWDVPRGAMQPHLTTCKHFSYSTIIIRAVLSLGIA